jgi:hypothetical protein
MYVEAHLQVRLQADLKVRLYVRGSPEERAA